MKKTKRKKDQEDKGVELIQDGNYLFVRVRKDAERFVVDNHMEYLIYRVPNYANWCNDDILEDWGKLEKFLDEHDSANDYKTGGAKLPPGKWRIIGKANTLLESDWGEILAKHNMKPTTTLILKKTR